MNNEHSTHQSAGRPRKRLDAELVEQLARAQLTNEEIARIVKCSPDTIERRYGARLRSWKAAGVGSVRRELFMQAMGTGKSKVTACIFFLKNYGGMRDNVN